MRSLRTAVIVVREDPRKGVRWGGLAAGLAFSVATISFQQPWLAIASIVLFGWGLRDFIKEIAGAVGKGSHHSIEAPASRLCHAYAGEYGPEQGWLRIGTRQQRTGAITSPQLNRRLASDSRIELIDCGDEWQVPEWLEPTRQKMLYLLHRDETKIRLASDLGPASTSVQIQPVKYSAFLVTNRLAYESVRHLGHEHLSFDRVGVVNGEMPSLSHSHCSNHLGGDILAVGDGFFWLQWQASGNVQSRDTYAASGSGSFDWQADRRGAGDLVTLVKRGMLRELAEELGLQPQSIPSLTQTRVIGYARTDGLGGKPAFYGVCKIEDVPTRVSRRERSYASDHIRVEFDPSRRGDGLRQALRQYVDDFSRCSVPLLLLTEMVEQWLEDSAAVEWLFG